MQIKLGVTMLHFKMPLIKADQSPFDLVLSRSVDDSLIPTKPPHTLCVRRCPFSPFFLSGSQPGTAANQRVPKKNFTTVNEFMCESSDREAIEFGGAGEGTNSKRQCYVAVSYLIQLWQSDTVAVFSVLFFWSVKHHGVQPVSLTMLPFEIGFLL